MDQHTQLIMYDGGVEDGITAQATTLPGMPTTLNYIPSSSDAGGWSYSSPSPTTTYSFPQILTAAPATTPVALQITPQATLATTSVALTHSLTYAPSVTPIFNTPRLTTTMSTATGAFTNGSTTKSAESSSVVFGLSRRFVVIGACIIGFVLIAGIMFTYLACSGSERKERRKSVRATRRRLEERDVEDGRSEKVGYKQDDLDEIRNEMPTFMLEKGGGGLMTRSASRSSVRTGPVTVASYTQDSLAKPVEFNSTPSTVLQTPRSKSTHGHISMPKPAVDSEKKRYTFGLRKSEKESSKRGPADNKASARASIETFTSGVAAGSAPFQTSAQLARVGEGSASGGWQNQSSGTRYAQPATTPGQLARKSVHPGDIYTGTRPASTVSNYSQATAAKHATRYGQAHGDHTQLNALRSPVPTINIQMVESIPSKLNEIGQKYQMQRDAPPSSMQTAATRSKQVMQSADSGSASRRTDIEFEHSEILGSPPAFTSHRARTPATPSRSMPSMTNQSSSYSRMPPSPTSRSLPIRHVKSILKPSRTSHVESMNEVAMPPSDSYRSLWEASVGDGNKKASNDNRQTLAGTTDIGLMLASGLELSPETMKRDSLMSSYYNETAITLGSHIAAPKVQPLNIIRSAAKSPTSTSVAAPFPILINDKPTSEGQTQSTAMLAAGNGGDKTRESVGYKRVMSVFATYDDGGREYSVYDV